MVGTTARRRPSRRRSSARSRIASGARMISKGRREGMGWVIAPPMVAEAGWAGRLLGLAARRVDRGGLGGRGRRRAGAAALGGQGEALGVGRERAAADVGGEGLDGGADAGAEVLVAPDEARLEAVVHAQHVVDD